MSEYSCTLNLLASDLCLSLVDYSFMGKALEVLLFLVAFAGLAAAAEHLCNSMETLCDHWRIHEDVGGATFIALGGALPEITINSVSTLRSLSAKTKDDASIADMGVGAILGSGLIAFLVIPSLACFFSRDSLVLRRKAVYREGSFYILALLVLLSALYTGVRSYHGLLLVSIYILFVVSLVFGEHLGFFWGRELGNPRIGPLHEHSSVFRERMTSMKNSDGDAQSGIPLLPLLESSDARSATVAESGVDTTSWIDALLYPVRFAVDWTCPDCRIFQPKENWYLLTFLASFAWISVFSFIITLVVQRWVEILNIPSASALFGVIVVAVGAEIPDAVNAVTIARRGFGGMAISACLGSQVVNICLGLGMPWLVTRLVGETVRVSLNDSFMTSVCVLLLLAVVVSLVCLAGLKSGDISGRTQIGKNQAGFLFLCYCVVISIMSYMAATTTTSSLHP